MSSGDFYLPRDAVSRSTQGWVKRDVPVRDGKASSITSTLPPPPPPSNVRQSRYHTPQCFVYERPFGTPPPPPLLSMMSPSAATLQRACGEATTVLAVYSQHAWMTVRLCSLPPYLLLTKLNIHHGVLVGAAPPPCTPPNAFFDDKVGKH